MLTNQSEQKVTQVNQNVFYKEFTFSKNDFRSESKGEIVELADNIILLDDLLIIIQIKERNKAEAHSSLNSWFRNKVLKKAKNQIKNTIEYIETEKNISISNELFQSIRLEEEKIRIWHSIIIYDCGKDLPEEIMEQKSYTCQDGTFIHIMNLTDYAHICRYLQTPTELEEYLRFRCWFLQHYGYSKLPEQYIFVHFLVTPESSIIEPRLISRLPEICDKMQAEEEQFSMYAFFSRMHETLKQHEDQYRKILTEVAKLSRTELRCYKERFIELMNSEPDIFDMKRFYVNRTDCGFMLLRLGKQQENHWQNALTNMTTIYKYQRRAGKCLGVIIMHADNEKMVDVNWCYIESPWEYDEFLEKMAQQAPGISTSKVINRVNEYPK